MVKHGNTRALAKSTNLRAFDSKKPSAVDRARAIPPASAGHLYGFIGTSTSSVVGAGDGTLFIAELRSQSYR